MDLKRRIELALDEDLGPGDLTTEATIPANAIGRGEIITKQPLVLSGLDAARAVFEVVGQRFGAYVAFQTLVADGARCADRQPVARITGNMRAILVGERLALNLLMRMSGIATHVRGVLDQVGPATFHVVDTRKTTPLWRDLEKAAVRHGGGRNHRFGLFDGVLIKDNHIAAVGGVGEAILRAREAVHHLVKIEVEVTALAQIDEALRAGADGLLLDNMDDATLAAAIELVRASGRSVFLEASGNMNAERLKRIAAHGLDLVSMGGLIHQARWADLSLDVVGAGEAVALVNPHPAPGSLVEP
jgi:nicotinate-nucleotide pyrophosphorylase (carboxylating)